MQLPSFVSMKGFFVATSTTQRLCLPAAFRPKAIRFPFGDQDGHVSSDPSPAVSPVSFSSRPPAAAILNTRNWENMALCFVCIPPPTVTVFVVSKSLDTYAIHLPSYDHTG